MRPADAFADAARPPGPRPRPARAGARPHAAGSTSTRDAARGHNERLEFLGDAVVNLAISEALYARHPDDDEGVPVARAAPRSCRPPAWPGSPAGSTSARPPARRGRGAARRPPPAVAPGLGVRGASRARSTSTSASSAVTRLARRAGRARSSSPTRRSSRSRAPKSRLQEYTQRRTGDRPDVPARRRDRARTTRSSFRIEVVGRRRACSGVGEGPSRRIAETAAAAEAIERCARRACDPGGRAASTRDGRSGRWPPQPRLLALRAQGFKSFAERTQRRVRPRDQRGRRAERLGQEQPRRRPALGARRAGPGAPVAQGRGRHLGRLGQARRAGHGRRDARPRQRRRPAAGRLPGPRARPPAVPLGRERLPAQQAARSGCATSSTCSTRRTSPTTPSCSSARAWSTRRSRSARRSAGRCSRRSPGSAATSDAGGAAEEQLAEIGGEPGPRRGHPRRAPAAGAPAGRRRPSSRRSRETTARGAGRRAPARGARPVARQRPSAWPPPEADRVDAQAAVDGAMAELATAETAAAGLSRRARRARDDRTRATGGARRRPRGGDRGAAAGCATDFGPGGARARSPAPPRGASRPPRPSWRPVDGPSPTPVPTRDLDLEADLAEAEREPDRRRRGARSRCGPRGRRRARSWPRCGGRRRHDRRRQRRRAAARRGRSAERPSEAGQVDAATDQRAALEAEPAIAARRR